MNENRFYYTFDGKVFGPFEFENITQMVNAGIISGNTLVAFEGTDNWHLLSSLSQFSNMRKTSEGESLISGFAGKVSQASGLEKLEGFSLSALFSEVFAKHSPEDIEARFIVGTTDTTPIIQDVSDSWPTPWAFVRLLVFSVLISLGFYYAIDRFNNPILIPGWIFVGCFGIPFAVLIFFLEANILRNVSFYRMISLMMFGGLLSLVASLFLFEYTPLDNWLGAMSAGIIEETGKLLAVIFFTRKWLKYNWTLNGMLFGAAVGTGFSAFETSGYVFLVLMQGESFGSESTMILRALLSPFTHTIWTAATAAALWRVKGSRNFDWPMLVDIRFIRIFAIIAGLHLLWNSPLSIPIIGGMAGYLGLRVFLGVIGWIIIFSLMQSGIKEVREVKNKLAHR